MKYETPELEVIELDELDIIQTSGEEIGGAGGENETPINPVANPDSRY